MTAQTDRIQKAYDEWAEIYDSNENPTRDINYQTIREEQLDLAGKNILEIGCGTGLNTEYLAQQAEKVLAVDISEEMLKKARQRVEADNVHFITADITTNWQFSEETFDLIVANLVLEHIEQLSHVFAESYKILNPKGKLYIAELHPYKQLQNSQAKFISQKSGEKVLVDAYSHSVSEYVNEAIAVGFNLIKISECHYKKEKILRLITFLLQKSDTSI